MYSNTLGQKLCIALNEEAESMYKNHCDGIPVLLQTQETTSKSLLKNEGFIIKKLSERQLS